ncbi:MAG: cytidylate kinase-like family protein [Pseudomonadota bacterium]
MASQISGFNYQPGMYSRKRPTGSQLAENYFREMDKHLIKEKKEKLAPTEIPPTICFSRKIGVGALKIADILAPRIGYNVVDREILEHIAKEEKLNEKTVALFDERYSGKLKEFVSFLFAEKSFIKSDYARYLFNSVVSIAGLSPTIIVGRGAHLILPRDRVLAVRFICSETYRINRLVEMLECKPDEARAKLEDSDKEQQAFFKKVFGKKDALAYEFDMVINCDFITRPEDAADIVECAFKRKFGL